jgi:hypothetical protein
MHFVILDDQVWAIDSLAEIEAAKEEMTRLNIAELPVYAGTGDAEDESTLTHMILFRDYQPRTN